MDYYILGAVILAIILYFVITMFRVKKAVINLTQEKFIEGYRKAQLIDVREPKEFEAGHILGPAIFLTHNSVSVLKKSARTSPSIFTIITAVRAHERLCF